MAKVVGRLDRSGSAVVAVSLSGSTGALPPKTFEAVVDTGFTGFVQMPTDEANALGLQPIATSDVELADGKIRVVPLAWVRATLGRDEQEGFAHIQRGTSEVTVGIAVMLVDDLRELI